MPDHKKSIVLKALELEDEFVWICDGVYPVEVQFAGDYNKVWKEFEPFINGACVNLIPTNFEKEGKEYIIQRIETDDEELNAFLFSLGCYSGEPITVVSHLRSSCTVSIKDGRYNIDNQLAEAILI